MSLHDDVAIMLHALLSYNAIQYCVTLDSLRILNIHVVCTYKCTIKCVDVTT